MSKASPRSLRVADQIQRILADLIQRELRDPRLGMVSVTGVDVSRDFAHATVYVTVMGLGEAGAGITAGQQLKDMGELDRRQIEESLAALNNAAGYLRGLLAKQIKLRTIPALQFHYDESVARGQYLSSLIERAITEDSERQS